MTSRHFGCAALLVLLSLIGGARAAPTLGGCPVFPANNYWNTPVDSLPVHASSAAWVDSIGAATRLHPDWGNVLADNYGIPFATVTGSQPKVPITFDPDGYSDESDPGPFPIPPNAPIEGGNASDGDRHVIVVDTTNCMLYELFYAFPVSGGASWRVYSAARFDLNSNALRPDTWTSADAAGFAVLPGLVRWDEVAAGEIAHAIRFTASRIWGRNANGPYYLWPARHWSGSSTDSTRPPMGARFRLKSSFDISGFDARTQVILRAFKKYGLVLADAGSNWYFQGVSDAQWPDVVLDQLQSIAGSNFEAVDTSVMQVDPNTAEAKQAGSTSYQGLWLKSPLDESGWGVNLTHQGNILVATWFTYDSDGSGMWLVMSNGSQTSAGNFSGTLYRTTGPPFNATPFTPIVFPNNYTTVGTLSFSFTDANNGTMTYTVNGITQSKPIGRLIYASGGTNCLLGGAQGASPNFQDLWLAAPLNSEAGWGVNLTHQGDILFATWFTYEAGGKGMWLVMSRGDKTAPGVYTGELQRTTGPAFNAVPFNPNLVTRIPVGSATFRFSDANNGTFSYTVNGISQSKPIARLFYSAPPTVCN
jgi:hypothetical protein